MSDDATRRAEPVSHWAAEIIDFRADAEYPLTATIRRMVQDELESLRRKAAKIAAAKFLRDEPDGAIDPTLRWTWAEIMGEENDPLEQDFPLKR